METKEPGPSEAIVLARAKAARLAQAFVELFGHPGKRTEMQLLVMEHLELCAADDQNAYRFNEAKDGLALLAAGVHRDGARSILRVIERQISSAQKLREKPPAKPQVRK